MSTWTHGTRSSQDIRVKGRIWLVTLKDVAANALVSVSVVLQRFAVHFEFDGPSLANAITSTFQRRQTSIPDETPTALTSEFFQDNDKNRQWNASASKLQSDQSLEHQSGRQDGY